MHIDPKKRKKTDNVTVFLCFLDLRAQKLLVEHWWNWHLVFTSHPNEINQVVWRWDNFLIQNEISRNLRKNFSLWPGASKL